MKIYTSYHGNVKKLLAGNIQPVNISRYPPRWANYPSIFQLAPSGDMLPLSKKDYVPRFVSLLNKLDPEAVMREIKKISKQNGGKDIALLCFEKPGDFCHRELVADWLSVHFNIEVKEYRSPSEIAKESQMKMF
jgi:hypothetical protein